MLQTVPTDRTHQYYVSWKYEPVWNSKSWLTRPKLDFPARSSYLGLNAGGCTVDQTNVRNPAGKSSFGLASLLLVFQMPSYFQDSWYWWVLSAGTVWRIFINSNYSFHGFLSSKSDVIWDGNHSKPYCKITNFQKKTEIFLSPKMFDKKSKFFDEIFF